MRFKWALCVSVPLCETCFGGRLCLRAWADDFQISILVSRITLNTSAWKGVSGMGLRFPREALFSRFFGPKASYSPSDHIGISISIRFQSVDDTG
jgi:hypothetical protein